MRSLRMPSFSALRAVQHIALLVTTGQFSIQKPRTQVLGWGRDGSELISTKHFGVEGPRDDSDFGVQTV